MKRILYTLILAIILSAIFIPTIAYADSWNATEGILIIDQDNATGIIGLYERADNLGAAAMDVKQLIITSDIKYEALGQGTWSHDIQFIRECTNMTKLDVASNIDVVWPEADGENNDFFMNNSNIKEVNFPAFELGENAFYDCQNLESVTLPNAVSIGLNAFYNIGTLTSISLPELTRLSNGSFQCASNLPSFSLPKVTSFGDSVFESASFDFESVLTMPANPPSVTGINGELLPDVHIDGSGMKILVPNGSAKTAYLNVDDGDTMDGCWYGFEVTKAPVLPYIRSTEPEDGDERVVVDKDTTNLFIEFSEAIEIFDGDGIIPGSIYVYQEDSPNDILLEEIKVLGDDGMMISSQIALENPVDEQPDGSCSGYLNARISLTNDLPKGKNIYIKIDNNIFRDIDDNAHFTGINDKTTWNFKTEFAAPKIVSTNPADDAEDVSKKNNLTITFDQDVIAGNNGWVSLYRAGGTEIESFQVKNSNKVTISGKTVTVNPSSDLLSNTEYYVKIASNAFRNDEYSWFAGINDSTTWSFKTAIDPPKIYDLDPDDNKTNVPIAANLKIRFNEDIVKGTGNIVLKKVVTDGEDQVVETFDIEDETGKVSLIYGHTIELNPTNDMPYGEKMYVTIDDTAIESEDHEDVFFEGISDSETWNFTTTHEPPTITSTTPAHGATEVLPNSNLTITFNENVFKGTTGYIEIKEMSSPYDSQKIYVSDDAVSISGSTVTINPTANMPSGKDVWVGINRYAFKNVKDAYFEGITSYSTWNFTIADAPSISSKSPADEATDVAIDSNLTMTFDQAISKGTGNIVLKKVSDDSVVETIAVTSSNVTVSDKTVTINPASDMSNSQEIYVEVASTAFKNSSDVYFAGISGKTTWNFTTVYLPPTISSTTPADNATGVAIDADLKITFDQAIKKGTVGDISIKKVSDDTEVGTLSVTSANVSISDKTVTINPTSDLPSSESLYVTIDVTAFDSTHDKDFAGISDKTTWNFTVAKLPSELSGLSISKGILSPAFDADNKTYTSSVAYTVGSIDITPSADSECTIKVNNGASVNGSAKTVNLSYGANIISIIVSRAGYADTEYKITVTRGQPPSFTITYNAKGGTGTETQTGTLDTVVTLSDGKKFSYDGYVLEGWEISSKDYELGALYTLSSDITAYANWATDTDGDGLSDADEGKAGTDPTDANDEPDTGTVVLTLLDSSGNPMAGCIAVLNSEPITTKTDSDGKAVFAGVTLSPHTLTVRDGSTQLGSYSLDFTRTGTDSTKVANNGSSSSSSGSIVSTVSSSFLTLDILLQGNASGYYQIGGVTYTLRSDGTYGVAANPKTGDELEENLDTGYSGFIDKLLRFFSSLKK